MKKYRVVWTQQARCDLLSIRRYIARFAPATAKAFVRRIRDRANSLKTMPSAATIVTDSNRPDLREVYVGSYRVVFRVGMDVVEIVTVVHGARMLTDHLDDPKL